MRNSISTRADGSMKRTDGSVAIENVERFLLAQGFPPNAVCMEQVHGGSVSLIQGSHQNVIVGVDALITDQKDISLCVFTADCLPILLYDPQKHIIGAVHAGRKGLLQNIIQNTIYEIKTNYASNPRDIEVLIGPCIEKACYQVDEEIIEQFAKQFNWFDKKQLTSPIENNYFLDLRNTALQCLLKEDILEEHIQQLDICTKCNRDIYYSYRGGDKIGRFVSVISLV